MKGKHNLATRLGGGFLAAIMLLNILPVSTIAMAVGSAPVEVKWIPNTQTKDGTRTVTLTAQLTQNGDGAPKAAMVEISLTAEEAGALSWEGETISDSDLAASSGESTDTDTNTPDTEGSQDSDEGTTQAPDTEDSQDSDPETPQDPETDSQDPSAGQQEADGTEPSDSDDDTEETETPPATVAAAQSRAGGEQAVLIKKSDDGGAVLRILLSEGTYPYTKELTFISEKDTTIHVDNSDINVETYEAESVPSSITAVGLLTAGNANASITTSDFTVFSHIPEEIAVSASPEPIDLDDDGSKDIVYTVELQQIAAGEDGKDYTLSVALLESLSLPAGALSYSNGSIQCGETQIATLKLPGGITIKDDSLTKTDNSFSFIVTVPAAVEGETEIATHEITLTLHADKLARSSEAFTGSISLTVNAEGEGETAMASAAATVTAGGATLPGEGGWNVQITKTENLNQNVFWRDNEQTSARPAEWDNYKTGFWPTNAKLYYTLTDENGVTYERTLLTEDTLKYVGLTSYPGFAVYNGHGFTVEDLPHTIQQVDPNDETNVRNTYTITWSLEPPENVAGYDFRNISQSQVGIGNEYPSIDTPGWYYMQKDSFTFTLNIRQGEEDPLGEDDERAARLRALLQNFQFNWSYADIEDSNGILDMIEAFHAVPSYNEGTITINGMWKYNVDGSPINYSVTEIRDDTNNSADGKITAEELGDEESLLEDGEWYQIQYVNTGVPGEGQDTTALHSGGTLQLVRQGNTQYEATKIWLDSYGDSEGSGRPTANFTLYRYRKGEDPSTAAQLNGYTIQLKNKEAASGYSVQVMKEDGETTALADLPKYDTLDGAEFIYVVRETLSGDNAGQYEQVFGTVTVGETGKIEKTTATLPVGALPDGSTDRPAGNTYLYNDGTLTNYQTGTIPVFATKTWLAAAYQSTFDDVAVELTLQYREKDSGDWQTYKDSNGESVIRYLHRFYAESLSDTLMDPPSMPQYQTTQLSTANQELEYRWLETAVYTDAVNATETNLGGAKVRINIDYPTEGENSANGNNPKGSFNINSSNYTVSYAGGTNNTQITNSVSEYLNYEVIKEWHSGSTPQNITIQILRSVAGGDFNDYLEFTMNAGDSGTVTVTGPTPAPTDVSTEFEITGGTVEKVSDENTTLRETWNATVSGLPRFDKQGRPYEYLLLETNAVPTYETTIDDTTGDYTTKVINGSGDGGFNLLVRKVWLDDGDMEHREPVTFTLYNKNNNQPVTKSEGSNDPYTITLGGENEENLWHKVVRISTTGLGNITEGGPDNEFNEKDVYLVETEVGTEPVDHHLEAAAENVSDPTYDYLYRERTDGEPIFEVKTTNHRYQVTYEQVDTTSSEDPVSNGVGAAFTITNRRLGSIDLTVTKDWVDGREGDSSQVLEQIEGVLEEYAKEKQTYLALAFRLVFDDSMADKSKAWNITYSGPSAHSDTVCVGGEKAQIYSAYKNEEKKSDGYSKTGSSEWIILGYVKDEKGNWTFTTDNSAQFLGLPKYDTNGEIVAYSIEEVWLDVTNANENTLPEVVDFDEEATQKEYSELYALWQDFSADYQWGEYDADVDGAHTRDEQTLKVTNVRRGSKTVQWTVEWQDEFTHNSDLRPDIYLDIYQVTYAYGDDGTRTPVISRVTGRTLDWEMDNAKSWTATMSGVPAFDEKGNEIFYYAVQRTVMAAGDYDYQVAQYEMGETSLGTRDDPAEGVDALNSTSGSITNTDGDPYNLAVLGKRADETDNVESIAWKGNSQQPTNIGRFGGTNNYPKYALLEGGTIINTLAETYTIEGVKYWTNLPNGWEDSRLPQVTFTVSRSAQTETGTGTVEKDVAKVVISSELWEGLKNGTQYKYLIAYEGINVLGKETDDENGNGTKGEVYVEEVLDMTTNQKVEDSTPLARYQSGTGALWTYKVEETVNWEEGSTPDDGQKIFDYAPGGTGFTFTNNYNPTEGSIRVKKFLYLPMGEDGNPEAYPAVTFNLTRQVDYLDEKGYVADESFETQTVTLTSKQVADIWNGTTSVTEGNLIDSGKDATEHYIWATLQFAGLDIYAPNGTRYQYTVSEVKTWLNDYETWGKAEDVTDPSAFGDDNKGTARISGLEPEEVEAGTAPAVDATFKNQRVEKPQVHNQFTATKIWEDNNSAFRPSTQDFAKLLTLTRTAAKQGGTGGAVGITEVLTLWDETTSTGDYKIQITEDQTDTSKWTITIEPANGKSFEKYAPNGMEWTYTLKERVNEKNSGRLQITEQVGDDRNKIYTPSTPTPNSKTNGEWQYTITSTTQPVSGSDLDTYSFGSLTNSIMTLAKFEKKWVDAEGDPITQDYLGFDLTVEFQLQVREMDSNDEWADAGEWTYDNGGKTLGLADGEDTNALTGRVVGATHDWTYTFEDLPGVVQDSSNKYIFLEYRVIETKVSWDSGSQIISLPTDNTGDIGDQDRFTYGVDESLITDATFSRSDNTSTTTNKLATTSVSVTKVWDDTNNQYGTRPGGEGPWSWASWFVLQRTTTPNNEASWTNVALFQKLYGSNAADKDADGVSQQEKWEDTITGLPTMDYSDGTAVPYTYRVRELQPKEDGYTSVNEVISDGEGKNIVDPNGTYNPDGFHYTATYTPPASNSTLWTVTNSMDTPTLEDEVPKNVEAIKRWVGSDNGSVSSVTFQLQYKTEGSEWKAADFLSGGQWEKTANASNHWTVRWEDLPDTDGSNNQVTGYQVVEKASNGWVQIGEPVITHDDTTGTTTYSYTFTNSISTSYSVEKEWLPSTAATHEVTLGLYRTTAQEDVGSISGTPVPVDELATDGAKRTVTLDGIVDTDGPEKETWKTTFSNLPKYNASGQEYYYYALELDGNNNPIVQNGTIVLNNADYEVSYSWAADNTKTTVTNTTAISLTGTKTWKDDSNEGNTRPTNLTLILERRVNTDEWSEDLAGTYPPTWNKPEGSNEWTYTFSGLPSCDSSGALYEYRVREEVPTGYKLEKQKNNGLDGEVDKTGGNYDFTNIRTGTVSLVVNKTWVGDNEDDRPQNVTLKLERMTINDTNWVDITAGITQPTWTTTGNIWSLTYPNLPQFDKDGVRYEYRITEVNVPVDYEVKDSTNTDPNKQYALQNIRKGALEIRKEVSGNRGETDREFHFTVTLTRTSMAGTQAADVDGNYTAVYTKQDGMTGKKPITFTDGKSAEFTLKHNESLVIQGLPAGLSYEVTEVERNTNGYSTTSTGWTGTIPAGDTAQAEFENYRHSSSSSNRTDVSGTKTWVDDSNAAGLRPDVLELTLYRSVDGGPEQVVNATPTWTKTGNVWTYRYANLPKYDSSGRAYTYRVVETVPEGYVSTVSGNNFTNTLTEEEEKITLTGHKSWLGDTAEGRPESITVVLYDGDGQVVRRVTVTAAENWSYVFADLPRYDAEGNEIPYYVREEGVPAGYQVSYDGLNIVNRKEDAVGALRVTKQVTGTGAEYDRAFSFTVTLEDRTINGTYGEMTFVDGVATFTLRHGQSVTAVGLPAGIPYTVTETVPEGYAASNAQQAGEIPASDLATVTVVNHRDLPEEPTNPEDPEGPENPDVPDSPDDPAGPEDPQGPEVQTGDRANLTLYGGLAALFAAGLAVTLYWGKKEDRKKDDL